MSSKFRYLCQFETRRLLWLLGMVFAVVSLVQYLDLSCSEIFSLFSADKISAPRKSSPSLGNGKMGNMTYVNGSVHEPEYDTQTMEGNDRSYDEPSSVNILEVHKNLTLDNVDSSVKGPAPDNNGEHEITISPSPALPLTISSSNVITSANMAPNSVTLTPNIYSVEENAAQSLSKDEKSGLQSPLTPSDNSPDLPMAAVTTISEMNDLLLKIRGSNHSVEPRWSSTVDEELLYAKSLIENAPMVKNDPELYAPLYRNFSRFKRSYELMEGTLKVYVYQEGKKPIFHQPPTKGIYSSEGWFMKLVEENKKFITKDPRKAHLFYLPFSSQMLEETLYINNSNSFDNFIQYLKDYLDAIVAAKYPFWNRTEGSDHFLVACHDWAPAETRKLMANCIKALCNADIREGFKLGQDVSLPETYVRRPENPLRELGGKPPSQRQVLAFFAGSMHGYVRPILLKHWENKDPDMKIYRKMPRVKKGRMNYIQHMKSSKYCICAKGYEVNSPRVVEAIFYECVPVIISDNFVPPFFEVLNWESFAVFILEKDIPNLKRILLSIPERRYLQMQMRVKKVQLHFLWHPKPVKYDLFHMILHSVWYNRVFRMRRNSN